MSLIPGSGAVDMNETLAKKAKPFWQISQYLTERGFVVLRYDKRGIGANSTIINSNVWGNVTVNDLIHDAERALNVLMRQPEVDPKGISIIGHSEGTVIAPRVVIDNLMKGKEYRTYRSSCWRHFQITILSSRIHFPTIR